MGSLGLSLLLILELRGAGTCPSAAEVERRLAPLLAPGFQAHSADVATLEPTADGAVTVLLDGPDGGAIAHKRLPRAVTCGDQAETVAVTLAIWQAQLHPEITLRLDRLPPAAAAAPLPAAAVQVTPPDESAVQRATPATERSRAAFSIGAGIGGDWQPGSVAPGGRVEVTAGAVDSRWRARAAIVSVGAHTLPVEPGEASWWRVYGALGADVTAARAGRLALVLGVAGVLGATSISGSGFTINHQTRSVDLGGELLARGEWRAGRLRPWLGLTLVGWARRQQLDVTGDGLTSAPALPRTEPMLAAGADFLW